MADAIIVGGANGAGKTTFARQFLPTLYPDAVFLNADEIQREAESYARPISAGFRVSLHFIELPSEDYAVYRVAARVAAGGHWKSDDGGLRLVQHHER